MKKLLSLIMALLLSLSLCACGGGEEGGGSEPPAEEGTEAIASAQWSNKTGSLTLDVVGAETFTDSYGQNAIRVYYDFTNNTELTVHLADELDNPVFTQDGTELQDTTCEVDLPESYNDFCSIRPGVTIRCIHEYALISESPVTVSLTATYSDEDGELMNFELDPANLPGAPAEPLAIEPITDPVWIKDLPSEGVYHDDFYVAILSAEVVGDEVHATFSYTNNSDMAVCFGYAVYDCFACQDGYELEQSEDFAYWEDIPAGETVEFTVTYQLISDSPVEIEVFDPWSDGGIGMIVNVQ